MFINKEDFSVLQFGVDPLSIHPLIKTSVYCLGRFQRRRLPPPHTSDSIIRSLFFLSSRIPVCENAAAPRSSRT